MSRLLGSTRSLYLVNRCIAFRTCSTKVRQSGNSITDVPKTISDAPDIQPVNQSKESGNGGRRKERRSFRQYAIYFGICAGAFHAVGYAARYFKSNAACAVVENPIEHEIDGQKCIVVQESVRKQTGNDVHSTVTNSARSDPAARLQAAITEATTLLARFKVRPVECCTLGFC